MKTGGLGDVAGSLPSAVTSSDYEVRVILPKLSVIPESFVKKMEFVTKFSVPLGWRVQYCGLFRLKYKGIQYYFLDNEYYFKRRQVYGEYDDVERAAFFSKAVPEALLHIEDYVPDIIHANDWHTAMVPVFLKEHFKEVEAFAKIRTIFTIHNLKFQGRFSDMVIGDILGLSDTPAEIALLSDPCTANYMKGACLYSDRITTVSPTYAEEICTPDYGEGLDWIFTERKAALSGILNGIDTAAWDPADDKEIPVLFDVSRLAKKKENKRSLQKELGLKVDEETPLFVIISRLTEQKGLDLVKASLPALRERKLQLAVLGVGEPQYEDVFSQYAIEYPQQFAAQIRFDNGLSHRMYAGADVMLVPSRFEPCGLTQMIAMRYGTLPLVRETGGLKDTVNAGNGFSFADYDAEELLQTVDRVLDLYYLHKKTWVEMQKTAMEEDFSWKSSAKEYRRLYSSLL